MNRTVHYMGDTIDVYVQAILRLIDYSSSSTDDFEFGPIGLRDLKNSGLMITGEVEGVRKVLGDITGLIEV